MCKIVELLIRSLKQNECVVLPGIGAFVREYTYAHYNATEHMLYPPSVRVHFNGSLVTRDGILDRAYAQDLGLSPRRARIALDTDLAQFRQQLFANGSFPLGSLGQLVVSDGGAFLFLPEDQGVQGFASYAYGLSPQVIVGLTNKTEAGQAPTREVSPQNSRPSSLARATADSRYYHLRIHKGAARWSTAAVVVLSCLIPVTSDPVVGRYSAGFFSSSVPAEQTSAHLQEVPPATNSSGTPEATTLQLTPEAIAAAQVAENKPSVSETAPLTTTQVSETKKTESQGFTDFANLRTGYYPIVSVFQSTKRAKQFIDEVSDSGVAKSKLRVIKKGKNYLVAYGVATTSQDAYNTINQEIALLPHQAMHAAWVLEK